VHHNVKRDNLIIDVGAHIGQDTEFYLAKGFDVVAIEANPILAGRLREKFAESVDAGRLRILNVAIAAEPGTQQLAVADDMTIWSSLSPEFIRRNEAIGTKYRYIDVEAVTFADVLADVGIPHYLKIDIEGLDMLCVETLHQFAERPTFLSLESHVSIGAASFDRVFDELAHLWVLGYRTFQYVDQRRHPEVQLPTTPREGLFVDRRFSDSSSGPFGDEVPGEWRSISATVGRGAALWLHHSIAGFGGKWTAYRPASAYRRLLHRLGRSVGWYDLHARRR
jgi:FkbM family methyltransferase